MIYNKKRRNLREGKVFVNNFKNVLFKKLKAFVKSNMTRALLRASFETQLLVAWIDLSIFRKTIFLGIGYTAEVTKYRCLPSDPFYTSSVLVNL